MKVKWLIRFQSFGDYQDTLSGKVNALELLKIQSPGYPNLTPIQEQHMSINKYGYVESRKGDGSRVITVYIEDVQKLPKNFHKEMNRWMRQFKMDKILNHGH
jgi:hypothetical protein